MWLYDSSTEWSFMHPVACELSWQLCCFGQPAFVSQGVVLVRSYT